MTQAGHRMVLGGLCALALSTLPQKALADAGGLSFWLPGAFGSLAATPTTPGWAYETIYLHLQQNAGGGKNFVTSGGGTGSVVAGLNARADALAASIASRTNVRDDREAPLLSGWDSADKIADLGVASSFRSARAKHGCAA